MHRSRQKPLLDKDIQLVLGASLRGSYDAMFRGVPLRLLQLLRGLRHATAPQRAATGPAGEPALTGDNFETKSFDPDTLAVLKAALDEAWATLKNIGDERISRDEVAQQLLDLAAKGERSPSRLCSRALVELIAPNTPVAEPPDPAGGAVREPPPSRSDGSEDPVMPTMWQRDP